MTDIPRRDYSRCPKCQSDEWEVIDSYGKTANELHFLCRKCGYEEIMVIKQPGEKLTRDQKRRGLIPIPDPLGLMSRISQGFFFDPLFNAREIEKENGIPKSQEGLITVTTDSRVDVYVTSLKKAYELAPCSGCKQLVKSAIVGAKIYQRMLASGKSADEIKGEELEKLTKEVTDEVNGNG